MRKVTGTPVFESGKWWAKITLEDGSRYQEELSHLSAEEYPPTIDAEGKVVRAEIPDVIIVACQIASDRERATGKILAEKRASKSKFVSAFGQKIELQTAIDL